MEVPEDDQFMIETRSV